MEAIALDQPYYERAVTKDGRLDEMLIRGQAWTARRMAPLRRLHLARFAMRAEQIGAALSDLPDRGLMANVRPKPAYAGRVPPICGMPSSVSECIISTDLGLRILTPSSCPLLSSI